MSEENIDANLLVFATRLVERTIERALDVIYEENNEKDFKIQEWRHSFNQIQPSTLLSNLPNEMSTSEDVAMTQSFSIDLTKK